MALNKDLGPANGLQGQSYLYDFGTSPQTRTAVSQKVRVLAPAYGSKDNALLQMGVLSSLALSESRSVEAVQSIGFGDIIHELVPGVTEAATGSVERALLYLANIWQATGYAGGVDGPVRSLRHHRWPFDIEEQLVFSTLADQEVDSERKRGTFDGGTTDLIFPTVTPDLAAVRNGSSSEGNPADNRSHKAVVTIYEACWWTSFSRTYAKDSGIIMESGDIMISDLHDFSSLYGEFLATGNDPTIGQLGSIRFGEFNAAGAGGFTAGGDPN